MDYRAFLLVTILLSSCLGFSSTPSWSGDLRVRAQNETNLPGESRLSQKLRARLDIKMEVEKNLRAEIRIASAKSNNSTNQTLGDNKEPGMARRFMGLDLAYAEWMVFPKLHFSAGRVPQIHDRPGGSQMILDSDLALEGASLAAEYCFDSFFTLRTSMGSAWIRENYDSYYSEEQADNMLNWGQLVSVFDFNPLTLNIGLGFFNFLRLQGSKFSDISTGGASRGNSEEPKGSYKNNYVPRSYFFEIKSKYDLWTWGLFTEYIVNGETTDPNRATWAGFNIGNGPWVIQASYATLDSDVVPGIFTDSDFAGGSTDAHGTSFSGQWKYNKWISLGLTQYWTQKRTELGDMRYDRTHLDLGVNF